MPLTLADAYKRVNTSDRRIKGKVEYLYRCTDVTNSQKPTLREDWLKGKKSIKLRQVWESSSCEHHYQVLSTDYW